MNKFIVGNFLFAALLGVSLATSGCGEGTELHEEQTRFRAVEGKADTAEGWLIASQKTLFSRADQADLSRALRDRIATARALWLTSLDHVTGLPTQDAPSYWKQPLTASDHWDSGYIESYLPEVGSQRQIAIVHVRNGIEQETTIAVTGRTSWELVIQEIAAAQRGEKSWDAAHAQIAGESKTLPMAVAFSTTETNIGHPARRTKRYSQVEQWARAHSGPLPHKAAVPVGPNGHQVYGHQSTRDYQVDLSAPVHEETGKYPHMTFSKSESDYYVDSKGNLNTL